MLDDLKYIHEKDMADALGIVAKQAAQLAQDFTLKPAAQFAEIHNIVYGAMGGSALAALLVHSWPAMHVPFELVRDYEVPAYINTHTLFIASSYSGNTEETLAALEQAAEKGAQIAVITSGGKLQQVAEQKNYPLIVLPKVDQPRYAVLFNYKALLTILEAAGIVHGGTAAAQAAVPFLNEAVTAWLPTVPTAKNAAKQLAQEMLGTSVVIYSGPKLFPAAYKWKISVNENAKQVAWVNQFPEFNHNEFIGWSEQPVDKPYTIIDLRSTFETPRTQKRFMITARLLSGKRPAPLLVEVQGKTLLEQLLWASAYGDFVSIYLALLNGINPAPVDLVEKFKKELAK